ncbi:uncharacterized protein LOC127242336 [Andrographis paniculata]|uniref:uncharacterized protein LOC127242336 n=1 Tax=Andrographis paniculata TaxID=175694 RepID=UPI0021E79693|nr:uncharacterized protein LOC127242336 [Andrographis paniculata]
MTRGEAECSGLNEDCVDGIFIPDESTSLIAMQRCIVGEGQTFKGPQEFRKLLKNYSIATQKHFRYQKNDSSKIIAVCIDKGCGWRIYASFHARDASFSIRKCNLHHTCTMSLLQSRDHPAADANWISEVYKDKIRFMPAYKASDIREHIQTDYGIDVKYHKAWRGKENAIRAINGGGRDSFSQLPWYCHALRESNPGSIIDCEVEQATKRFQRLFVCLGACRLGFLRGCRPLLFLNGTHIKNKHKGCLLSAIAVDGDDGMFTLAFSAVSTENDENWEWFCWKLRSVLECEGRTDWKQYTFFSDRHSGLLKSISCVFPGAHHAYCLRHLVDNFRTQVMRRYPMHNKKRWTAVFNKAAYAPLRRDFENHISSVVESMPLARDFITQSHPECWANSLFRGTRWGIINNNIAESWNSWVRSARSMPFVGMLDTIRRQVMVMMNERREKSEIMHGRLCPKQESKLALSYMASRRLQCSSSSRTVFEVTDCNERYAVDLEARKCSCREWQMFRLPCKHACACIEKCSMSIYDFCDLYYSIECYRKTYQEPINPVPTHDMDVIVEIEADQIHPPPSSVQPGRPKKRRFESQQVKNARKCGRCGRLGHNRRSCKQRIE